nr:hypothetical protein [Tanacetum cinerariifolium]
MAILNEFRVTSSCCSNVSTLAQRVTVSCSADSNLARMVSTSSSTDSICSGGGGDTVAVGGGDIAAGSCGDTVAGGGGDTVAGGGGDTATGSGGDIVAGGGGDGDLDLLRDDDGNSDGGGEDGDADDGGNGISYPSERTIAALVGKGQSRKTTDSPSQMAGWPAGRLASSRATEKPVERLLAPANLQNSV